MKKIAFLSSMLVFLVSCQNNDEKNVREEPVPKVKVETEKIQVQHTELALKYSGSVQAWKTIPISFQVPGTVQNIYVEEGQQIHKNKLLASLDPNDLENTYAISLAKKQQAEDAYKRLKIVHDAGSLPEVKWVDMLTKLEEARSTERLAKSNLEKSKLLAPVDGFIGKRNIEVGMSAVQLQPTFQIVEIGKVYIKIAVPENEIGLIKKGQMATILVRALNNAQFTGVVDNIGIVASRLARTYTVRILVDNPNYLLKPGMVCDVDLQIGTEQEALTVPARSLVIDEYGDAYVYVLEDEKASMKKVSLGRYYNNCIEIVDGLQPGDVVVKEGKEKLVGEYTIGL